MVLSTGCTHDAWTTPRAEAKSATVTGRGALSSVRARLPLLAIPSDSAGARTAAAESSRTGIIAASLHRECRSAPLYCAVRRPRSLKPAASMLCSMDWRLVRIICCRAQSSGNGTVRQHSQRQIRYRAVLDLDPGTRRGLPYRRHAARTACAATHRVSQRRLAGLPAARAPGEAAVQPSQVDVRCSHHNHRSVLSAVCRPLQIAHLRSTPLAA